MSSRATRKANRKAARSQISECSVCLQVFPNQAERDRHTQSDHPKDASGSFYIPVERFKPKRVPDATNDKNPTEWVTEPRFGLTTRTPNAGHEGSKQNVVDRPDRRGHRSNPVHSSYSRDRGGKQVPVWGRGYHTSQPSQPTPDPKQPNIGLTGDMDSPYDVSRVEHIGPSAFAQTPEASATCGSVEVVGIRTPITHPAPAEILQPYCSTCTQAFPNQAAIEYHLIFCPTPIDQPSERSSSPLPPDTKSPYTKCYTYPSVGVAVSNSTINHGKRTGTPPPIDLDDFPRLRPPRIASIEDRPAPVPVLRCEPCKHDFPTQRALDLHLRNSIIHAPEHHCSICGLNFSTQGALVAHSVIVHGLELSCDQCDCWFAAEVLRAAHVRFAHQEPIAAPVPAQSKRSSNGSEGGWADLVKNSAPGARRTPRPLQSALARRGRRIRDAGDMAGSGTTPGPLQPKSRKLGRGFRDAGDI